LGGTVRQREPRRHEITHVPAPVRNRDRPIGIGEAVLPQYERIAFEKPLVTIQGQPLAAFVCPGHPLLDSVIDLTLERHRDLMKRGAVLVDERDLGIRPRVMFYLEHAIQDAGITRFGERRVVSKRMLYVELDTDGKPLTVREVLAAQEGDFDSDSRWALAWFEQMGFDEGEFGVAETLSKAKATSIDGMKRDGILASGSGKVRLLRPSELLATWEMVHQLIKALESGGEGAAAALFSRLGTKAEIARELAYRLYTLCEQKKRAAEALSYNGLVQSWPEISRLAREKTAVAAGKQDLLQA